MPDPVQPVPTATAPVAVVSSPSPVTETPAAVAPVSPQAATPPVSSSPVQTDVSRETKPEPAPAPAVVPAVESAPKPAEPAPAEAPKTPSLLAEAKAPESKPAEAKPAEETKPEPPKAPEPLKYEFKFPEGSNIPEERIAPYAEILGKYQVPPEAAQQLVDLYAAERQRELTAQHENWEKTQRALQAEFKADKEIGGAKWEATVAECGKVLAWFGQKHGAQHEQSLRNAFVATGLGNHAEFIRLLNDFSQYVVEKSQPVAATVPTPLPMGKAQRRYPTMQPNGAA